MNPCSTRRPAKRRSACVRCLTTSDHHETNNDVSEDASFRLTTVRSEGQFNSIIYEEKDSYRQTETRWSVLLNEHDIARLGVAVGDRVTLKSDQGRMDDVTVYAHDLPPGNAMAYYPEANCLTGTDVDPRSKTPAFKHTRIQIEASS